MAPYDPLTSVDPNGIPIQGESNFPTNEVVSELNPAAYNVDDNTLGQSEYDFNYTTFPNDISNDNIGHYMVININVPVWMNDARQQRTAYGGVRSGIASQTLTEQASKVDALRFGNANDIGGGGNFTGIVSDTAGGDVREFLAIPRFTRRIKESIALFMPTPVIYNTQNDYQEISLSALGTGLAAQLGGIVGGFVGAARGGGAGGEAGANIGTALGSAGGNLIRNGAMLARYPINPRVEVLFSRTSLRQFVFEFLFAPRNERESQSMERIIRTLRYHSVPEIDPTFFGATFIPPAEFDVTFFHRGVENTRIPRINTCVMDRIEVDYAPQGEYATFKNGHPVAARLSLGLREVEILHKRRVLQGF